MRLISTLFVALCCAPAGAQVERQHGAHVHGSATMNLALDGDTLEIELEAPGMDIVGFEHAARDPAQEAALADAIATLQAADWLILPAAAACTLSTASVHTRGYKADEPEHAHAHAHVEHGHDGADDDHSEFHGTLAWSCARPAALDAIEVRLGGRFPALERLTVVVLSDHGQSRVVLPGANGRVPLQP
jgi:hypothetical protein